MVQYFAFKDVVPRVVFYCSREREASVAALLSFRNGSLHWHINFSQNVQDWELESLTSFMDLINSLQLDGYGADWQTNFVGTEWRRWVFLCSPTIIV